MAKNTPLKKGDLIIGQRRDWNSINPVSKIVPPKRGKKSPYKRGGKHKANLKGEPEG